MREGWAGDLKLGDTVLHQPVQKLFTASRHVYQDVTSIGLRAFPPAQAALFHPVDEFDRAVMPNLEALREIADRRVFISRHSAHHQQPQILLRLQPGASRGVLAVVQKAPNQES